MFHLTLERENQKKGSVKDDCCQLYYFPITAITNYHKLRGLEQHKLILLQFWRLE